MGKTNKYPGINTDIAIYDGANNSERKVEMGKIKSLISQLAPNSNLSFIWLNSLGKGGVEMIPGQHLPLPLPDLKLKWHHLRQMDGVPGVGQYATV